MCKKSLTIASLAVLLCWPGQAQEQDGYFDRDRNESVRERPRPDYESAPMRMGSLLAYPELQLDGVSTDNVYASQDDRVSDIVVAARPSLDIASSWSIHEFEARLSVDHYQHFQQTNETRTDAGAAFAGKLDLLERTKLGAEGRYDLLHQPRRAIASDRQAQSPITYRIFGGNAYASREFGRTRLRADISYDGTDFDDAKTADDITIDQDYRDHTSIGGTLKGDYAFSPAASVFVRGRYKTISFAEKTPLALNRNQNGYVIEAGTDFDLTRLARGQIGVGYLSQSYEDEGQDTITGWSLDGEVAWFPSPLLTVTGIASRQTRVSGLASASSYIELLASAQADYELRRNILLSAEVEWGEDSYQNIDLINTHLSASIQGEWLVNRIIHLALAYSYHSETFKGGNSNERPDFSENRFILSLVLKR